MHSQGGAGVPVASPKIPTRDTFLTMPDYYGKIARKIFFPNIGGHVARATPVFYGYG